MAEGDVRGRIIIIIIIINEEIIVAFSPRTTRTRYKECPDPGGNTGRRQLSFCLL